MTQIINEGCATSSADFKNTGAKEQCTPSAIRTYIRAKEGFNPTLADAKLKATWDTAKANKDIVVFYDIDEAPTQNNTETTFIEGRFRKIKGKEGKRGLKLIHWLSDCSYNALESYTDVAVYTRLFRVLEDGTVTYELQSDGTVKGEPLEDFSLGVLNDSLDDKPQNAEVTITFKNMTKSVLKPDFDITEYEGVRDINIKVTSFTATEIVFEATNGCNNSGYEGLVLADMVAKTALGVAQTLTAMSNVGNVYTITGTGIVSGTLATNGVITKTNRMYESNVATF